MERWVIVSKLYALSVLQQVLETIVAVFSDNGMTFFNQCSRVRRYLKLFSGHMLVQLTNLSKSM